MRKFKARRVPMSDETDAFREFWSAWKPHMNPNDGRGEARDVFFEEVECFGANPEDIVDGAHWYLHRGGNKGVGFDGRPIKSLAASWIRKRQYEDGADDWRKLQASIAARAAQSQSENVVQMQPRPKTRFMQEWEARKQVGE